MLDWLPLFSFRHIQLFCNFSTRYCAMGCSLYLSFMQAGWLIHKRKRIYSNLYNSKWTILWFILVVQSRPPRAYSTIMRPKGFYLGEWKGYASLHCQPEASGKALNMPLLAAYVHSEETTASCVNRLPHRKAYNVLHV